jgi:hypothetical protein
VKKQYLPFIFAIAFYLFGLYALTRKIEPFQYFFYVTSWWSYIIFLDAAIALKRKRFFILNRYLPFLIIVSSGYWCLFELINIRLQNWFYINLPSETPYRYLGYLLGFGTVIPAIYLTQEAVKAVLGKIRVRPVRIRHYPLYALLLGSIALVLTVMIPEYCFPLAWIFAGPLFDGINYLCGYRSFMNDFEEGRVETFISSILSGLICGFLWELWNFWSLSKWVYSVPFFEKGKIFEMPLAGYVGFLVFGLETIVFMNFLMGIKMKRTGGCFVIIISILCSSVSFPLIDSYTVFSYVSKTESPAFLGPDMADLLKKNGIHTSYEIDLLRVKKEERETLELLHLKGLGYRNLSLLRREGINNVEDLSRVDEERLSFILKEKNKRRVRVYINAARDYVQNISAPIY